MDWLWYRPWTPEELKERVARSVANTCYRPWGGEPVVFRIPFYCVKPGGLSFMPLTDAEIAERDRKENADETATRAEDS